MTAVLPVTRQSSSAASATNHVTYQGQNQTAPIEQYTKKIHAPASMATRKLRVTAAPTRQESARIASAIVRTRSLTQSRLIRAKLCCVRKNDLSSANSARCRVQRSLVASLESPP